jgi:hypothetical protein
MDESVSLKNVTIQFLFLMVKTGDKSDEICEIFASHESERVRLNFFECGVLLKTT